MTWSEDEMHNPIDGAPQEWSLFTWLSIQNLGLFTWSWQMSHPHANEFSVMDIIKVKDKIKVKNSSIMMVWTSAVVFWWIASQLDHIFYSNINVENNILWRNTWPLDSLPVGHLQICTTARSCLSLCTAAKIYIDMEDKPTAPISTIITPLESSLHTWPSLLAPTHWMVFM